MAAMKSGVEPILVAWLTLAFPSIRATPQVAATVQDRHLFVDFEENLTASGFSLSPSFAAVLMFLVPLPANAVSPVKVKVMLKTSSVVEKRQKRGFTLSKSRSAMLSTPVSPSRKGTFCTWD